MFVRTPDAALAFWAMEEALKCGAPAVVVGEIWSLKGYSLAVSRRLLLAARKGKVPALLILASAYGQAERLSSAAETRFEIAAAPSGKSRQRPTLTCLGHSPAGTAGESAPWRLVDAVDSPSEDGRPFVRPMDGSAPSERGYRRMTRRGSFISNGEAGT